MRVCPKCERELPLSSFAKKGSGTQSRCRECHAQYTRQHYQDNRQYYIDKAAKRNESLRQEMRDHLRKYLADHPCVDCGEADLVVLQFDHVEGNKSFNIGGNLSWSMPWEKVEAEIAKCVVRCANCHIKRTAHQFGWWRLDNPT